MLISEGEGDGWYEAEVIEAKAGGSTPYAGVIGPTCRSSCADASIWPCSTPTLPRLKRRKGGGSMETQAQHTRSSAQALDPTARIRALNDAFRRSFAGGQVVETPGVVELAEVDRIALLLAVRRFDRFDAGNDPYGEHDFGSVEVGGERFFWKIDAYDGPYAAAHRIPPTRR